MTALPPVEKLPLAIRKNVRDKWDEKKTSFEKELSDLLGAEWTIDVNPLAIFPYAKPGDFAHDSLGACIAQYVEGAIQELQRFHYNNGDIGLQDLNTICHAKTLTIEPSFTGRFSCNGVDVTEGRLRLLFNPDKLNSNIGDCLGSSKLEDALHEAPTPESWGSPLTYRARSSIAQSYNKKIEKIRNEIAETLKKPDIKLNPNFEETFVKLKDAADGGIKLVYENWEKYLGGYTAEYFSNVPFQLRRQGFDKDDMLQEGLNEAVSSGEITFRIVDALKDSSRSAECSIEGGKLYLEATASTWGRNIDGALSSLIDIL